MWRKRRKPGVVVLGQQLADAHAAEERRQRSNPPPSPLGGVHYDRWRGEHRLSKLVPAEADGRVRELAQTFAAPGANRAAMREALSLDDFYTLLTFARRSTVRALREGVAPLTDGLSAIAMIDLQRVDPRDAAWALGLLRHGSASVDSAGSIFGRAAEIAEPAVANLIREAGARSPDDIRQWGYTVFNSPEGLALIGWGFSHYKPTLDLTAIGLAIADLVEADRYQPHDPEIACDVPNVWLSVPAGRDATGSLDAVAAVRVSAELRPVVGERPMWQDLWVWIAETKSDAEAEEVARQASPARQGHFVRAGSTVGRLVCLVVQSSPMEGGQPIETADSLQRFLSPISELLKSHRQSTHRLP